MTALPQDDWRGEHLIRTVPRRPKLADPSGDEPNRDRDLKILAMVRRGMAYTAIGEKFGVSKGAIAGVVDRAKRASRSTT